MSGIMERINTSLLGRYKDVDLLKFRKTQFVLVFDFSYMVLLLVMNLMMFTVGIDRVRQFATMAIPGITSGLIILVLVIKGKMEIGASLLTFISTVLIVTGFLTRSPAEAGVSLGYFMYVDLVFSAFFCPPIVSYIVVTALLGAHVYYYLAVAPHFYEGAVPAFIKSMLIDGSATIILVFVTGILTAAFSSQVVGMTRKELDKNKKQYAFIKDIVHTMEQAYNRLRESIRLMRGIIENFSGNAQTEAGSMKQLTGTFGQIAGSADNAATVTNEQNSSVTALISSIQNLSTSIERMETFGKNMSVTFQTLFDLAENGKRATDQLDESNRRITQNANDINSIIKMIEELFDRINMLALNATIEAARAGEHGRGFAVVADEIGKLADNSAGKLDEISAFIDKSKTDAMNGSSTINEIIKFIGMVLENITSVQEQSVETLAEIGTQKRLSDEMNSKTDIVRKRSELLDAIMASQRVALREVQKSIESTNKIVQDNAHNTEVLKEHSDDLGALAVELGKKFSGTKVQGNRKLLT